MCKPCSPGPFYQQNVERVVIIVADHVVAVLHTELFDFNLVYGPVRGVSCGYGEMDIAAHPALHRLSVFQRTASSG